MTQIQKKFYPDKYVATFSVEETNHNCRLDAFLMLFYPSHSRQHLKRKIDDGSVKISGRNAKHKPSTKLKQGDIVTITIIKTSHEDEYWRGEKLELEMDVPILFEDDELLAISKPPYMSTHPTGRHLFYCATVLMEAKYGHIIHSIHRLDRETSGVMLMAKTASCSQKIGDEFENRTIKKCYFLIGVKRERTPDFPFTAEERLGQKENSEYRMYIYRWPKKSNEGKHSKTEFHALWENDDYILALAFPYTGRQHQIRAHACEHGFPLLGDKLYDGGIPFFKRFKDGLATQEDFDLMQLSRQALHAIGINFPYFNEGHQRKTIISKLPKDIKEWIVENLSLKIDQLELDIEAKIKDYFKAHEDN